MFISTNSCVEFLRGNAISGRAQDTSFALILSPTCSRYNPVMLGFVLRSRPASCFISLSAFFGLFVFWAGATSSCSKPPNPQIGDWIGERDFIFISVDTLRADHLPFYGYRRQTAGDLEEPFSLAWLASRSQLFEQCWAPVGKTLPSLASFWTGLFPLEHGAIANTTPMQKSSLAQKFQDMGYHNLALLANRTLEEGMGLEQGFHSYGIAAKEKESFLGEHLLKAAKPIIADGEPLMLWAHWMSPHQPYSPPEPQALAFTAQAEPAADNDLLYSFHRNPSLLTFQDKKHCIGLYDAEILTAAQRIQVFLAGLDQSYRLASRGGLLENAVVVFFSDHGEELGDRHGYFLHAKSLYSSVLRVPLLIATSGLEPSRNPDPVALQRVLPWLVHGDSLQQKSFPGSWQTEYYSWRKDNWTLIHNPSGNPDGPLEPPVDAKYPYPKVALFDRTSDPNELIDVSKQHPEVVREMMAELHAWFGDLKILEAIFLPGTDPQARREELAALGYLDEVPDTLIPPWKPENWNP